eukprot:EG_transcript_21476
METPSAGDTVWAFHGRDDDAAGDSFDLELSAEELARIPPPPGEPLDRLAPLDLYLFHCDRYGVIPNSLFVQELEECTSLPSTFDFSANYVGPIGLLPVLELCATAPALTALRLSQQQLTDRSTQTLCEILRHHPGLCCLDLRRNLLGVRSARLLLRLLNSNPTLTRLDVGDTFLPEDWQHRLARTADRNAARLAGAAAAAAAAAGQSDG